MVRPLFTERKDGLAPRLRESLDAAMRTALFALVQRRLAENAFGLTFPFQCPDGQVNAGTDEQGLHDDMNGYRVIWPQEARDAPYEAISDEQLFEMLEYCFEKVAQPTAFSHHSFFSHDHYTFNQAAGRQSFEQEINRLFERNGVAFQMRDGQIERIAPTVLQNVLTQQEYATGDPSLNLLLQTSRVKFLSRDLNVRREALEKLWDAWERLKSLSDPENKRRSTELMLNKAAPKEHLRKRLEAEAEQLTQIGNGFFIRHSEVGKPQIAESNQVDWLFHRLFALIRLVLTSHGVQI